MSRLAYLGRPWVAFDTSNKDHRKWYYQFTEYNGWGQCPVRFICPETGGSGDLIMLIRNQLVEYYAEREFRKPTPKNPPGRRVISKRG